MADKPPPLPDQSILVYVQDYQNAALQTSVVNSSSLAASSSAISRKLLQVGGPSPGLVAASPSPTIFTTASSCGSSSSSSGSSGYRSYESPKCDSVRSEAAESTCSSLSSNETVVDADQGDFLAHESVAPPFGWKRLQTNGVVIYVSPSNAALSSTEQVRAYLQTEGTCKCGLECPLNCDVTFNFNPKVLTRPWTAPVVGPSDLTKLCNHKRKLLTQSTSDGLDNRYDGTRRKKRRVGTPQQPVTQLLSTKDQQSFNGLPWRDNSSPQYSPRVNFTNGYHDDVLFRYQDTPPPPPPPAYQRISDPTKFPSPSGGTVSPAALPSLERPQDSGSPQIRYETRGVPPPYQPPYDVKVAKNSPRGGVSGTVGVELTPEPPPTLIQTGSLPSVNRTPPWQQNRLTQQVYERVPPLHNPLGSSNSWAIDSKKKQQPTTGKMVKKRFNDEMNISSDQPSFMDDPSGYLAQQTALLNSTISRQNARNPFVENIPLTSGSVNKFNTARPKSRNVVTTSRYPDSSLEKKKMEEPSSTFPDRSPPDDRGPIQGATVSTSDRSPAESISSGGSVEVVTTMVTTMASGHTASSNTITSVLAGKTNTATVTVNNQVSKQSPDPQHSSSASSSPTLPPETIKSNQILVSSNGQIIMTNTIPSPQPQSMPKVETTSPRAVLNPPAVLVNTLPAPLLLQPGMVVDGLNTIQIPQIVSNVVPSNQVIDEQNLLSPDSKRKAASMKKRKLSPTVGPVLLSPQGSNNVVVQQPQISTAPMLQALTILPNKTNFAGTQQLIAANMLQPLNLVQNFPIQQFIVPAGMSGMVMSDGTILQDAVQLNLLTPVQNAGVFSNGQNLLTPASMVIRTPSTQPSSKVMPNNQFPNQYLVNNAFSGQLSPILSVSPPNQCSRNQEYLSQNVVVQQQQQQPVTSNTTVVQQNTTIVQQTTMVSSHQTQPTQALNLTPNFILDEKPNFILTSEKPNFILSPNDEKIIINPDNIHRSNFVLDKNGSAVGFIDKKNSVSTQTQNQVLQISTSPAALVVATSNTMCGTSSSSASAAYSESPPDTTTLSPVDQEVTTSLRSSLSPPSYLSSQSLPMVHCVSSSSQQEDNFNLDSYNSSRYDDSGQMIGHLAESNNDEKFSCKMSLCNVPDSVHIPNGEPGDIKEESEYN